MALYSARSKRIKHVLAADESLTAFPLLSKVEKPLATPPGEVMLTQVKEIPKSEWEKETRLLLQLMPGLVLTGLCASVMLHLVKHHPGF